MAYIPFLINLGKLMAAWLHGCIKRCQFSISDCINQAPLTGVYRKTEKYLAKHRQAA